MTSEQSYIDKFPDEMLLKYGLNTRDKDIICFLVNKSISEKLYTDTEDYQHNLKHIERVIAYVRMIINKMDHPSINEELLMSAALYHDIGKTIGASNQNHGLVGSEEFKKIMQGKMNEKDIEIISLLISQHASNSDNINFDNYNFSDEEKKSIQLMSNILKDADALDRNRLNYPAPIGTCDVNRLRTDEAKEVFKLTDSFYQYYCSIIINQREKETGKKILDNYELLDQWINDYENGQENMYHASLDPGIDVFIPTESTQKGKYVYGGINPINCYTMAVFRSSTIFPTTILKNNETSEEISAKTEIFEGSIEKFLNSKYVTIYKVPNEQFHEYVAERTASPDREWVSTEKVKPIDQVSFKAVDLLNYLKQSDKLTVYTDYSEKRQLNAFVSFFKTYMFGIKNYKSNPNDMVQRWDALKYCMSYYSVDFNIQNIVNNIKKDVDNEIDSFLENFKREHDGREPNYDDEKECLDPITKKFEDKYYWKDEYGRERLNYNYIYSLTSNKNLGKVEKNFDQRSESEIQVAEQIRVKNQAIAKQKQQQKQVEKQKVFVKTNPNMPKSSNGYVNVVILSLIVSFVAGMFTMIMYSILK